jgi:hypothetical protein
LRAYREAMIYTKLQEELPGNLISRLKKGRAWETRVDVEVDEWNGTARLKARENYPPLSCYGSSLHQNLYQGRAVDRVVPKAIAAALSKTIEKTN